MLAKYVHLFVSDKKQLNVLVTSSSIDFDEYKTAARACRRSQLITMRHPRVIVVRKSVVLSLVQAEQHSKSAVLSLVKAEQHFSYSSLPSRF